MKRQSALGALIAASLLIACGQNKSSSSTTSNVQTEITGKKWNLTTFKNPGKAVTPAEAEAAFTYTSEEAYAINDALRKGKASAIKRYATTILNLASLVNKSRGGKCTFYRFIDGNPKLLEQMKNAGQIFVEKGFFSTTLDRYPDDEGHFSNKKYIITGTSSRCADVSDYSRYQGENEVLFPPGTEFVVTKNMSGNNIYLREKQ